MKYICECCGKEKEDWPAIVYNSPSPYLDISHEEIENAELSPDFCVIRYSDETCYLSGQSWYRKSMKPVRILTMAFGYH